MTVTGDPATTTRLRANLEIVAVGLGALMAALSQTLVLPVLPTIAADIDATPTEAQWLLTSTLLVAAISVPILGRVADIFGRRYGAGRQPRRPRSSAPCWPHSPATLR